MATFTRAQIEALLETGDKPTQAEFVSIFLGVPNIQDDGILASGENGITAHASGSQINAYELTKKNNEVGTAAAPNASIKLLTGIAGMSGSVFNNTGNTVRFFPAIGGEINGLGVNNPLPLAASQTAMFNCYVADKWLAVG